MSLTMGGGPLAATPGGSANYRLDAPAHRIWFEPFGRRVRASLGGRVVLDSTRGCLLHETAILPVLYVPREDVDATALVPSDTHTTCPFKGEASYWSLRVGDRTAEDAVWTYPEPTEAAPFLDGFVALYADRVDGWWVEDEPVRGHLRDPYHRVDTFPSTREVVVTAGGTELARSTRPVLLHETGLPVRAYLPREDVHAELLTPTATTTVCPYKGQAQYWTVRAGDTEIADAAWSYAAPRGEAALVEGMLSFLGDGVTVDIADPPSTLGAPAPG